MTHNMTRVEGELGATEGVWMMSLSIEKCFFWIFLIR